MKIALTLKSLLIWLILPILGGVAAGLLYPNLGIEGQERIESGINELASPERFHLLALFVIAAASVHVIVSGPIKGDIPKWQRFYLLWLPQLVIGLGLPFFLALTGFFVALPASYDIAGLAALTFFAFIYSIGILLFFWLPSFASVMPSLNAKKRKLYSVALVSVLIGSYIHYFV